MASKFIILSVTAAVFCGAGCSKNRGWLSRNDYAEMQDPFMEPDSAVAKSSVGKSKASGRASLDNFDPSLAEGQGHTSEPSKISTGTTGPKPIRQAVASHGVTENGRRVAAATYPEDVVEDAPREGQHPTDGWRHVILWPRVVGLSAKTHGSLSRRRASSRHQSR